MAAATDVLSSVPGREREILIRFYLQMESPEELQAEYRLSEQEFVSIKARAREMFHQFRAGRSRDAQRAGSLRPLSA